MKRKVDILLMVMFLFGSMIFLCPIFGQIKEVEEDDRVYTRMSAEVKPPQQASGLVEDAPSPAAAAVQTVLPLLLEVPQPEKTLAEIRRVLKDDGVLIAPTFTHAGNSFSGKVRAFFMKLAGFPLHSKWTSEEYLRFLRQNGWAVRKSVVLKASFPLTYAECEKTEV